jgi:hypothetical protein
MRAMHSTRNEARSPRDPIMHTNPEKKKLKMFLVIGISKTCTRTLADLPLARKPT